MPGPKSPRPRSLTASLDAKILTLVRRYIDDKIDDGHTSLFHKGTLRLSVSALTQYVIQVGDSGLQRTKKNVLEKSIERAIVLINDEQAAEDGEAQDSDLDGMEISDLVEVKDTNVVNKRIVGMWGTKSAEPSNNSTPARTRASSAKPESNMTAIPETTLATNGKIGPASETSEPPKKGKDTENEVTVEAPTVIKKRKDKSSAREGSSKRIKPVIDKDAREPPSNISLDDLGGVEDVINDILELVWMPMTHPEVYVHTGVPPPRGILLHGPPGCGKTMIANAIAAELGFPFIRVSAPSIVSGMSGESEKTLRDLFDESREKAPCIMFFDEIDAITPKRESAQREMERRIVAQMLTCMDELTLDRTGGKPVMVIGATNRPDSLDPALRRAGRFDREICMSVPDELGREKILRALSKKLRLSGDFNFSQLAKLTPGFVGADLSALTAAAGVCAIKRIFTTLKDVVPIQNGQSNDRAEGSLEMGEIESAMDIDTEQNTVVATSLPQNTDNTEATTIMNITTTTIASTNSATVTPNSSANSYKPQTLHNFFRTFDKPLTPEELAPLSITLPDFLAALPKIQPSSKREGFATVPNVTWADIGALDQVRTEMQMAIVQPIRRADLYERVGLSIPTGVLLWGPPGCGKTLLAKAVANESQANFISVRGPELLNKYVGESERAVRQVFSRARASVPCIIFFDELDALVPRRNDSLSDASARVVNTLLTELDGLSDRKGVFVVGATNRPDCIDPAMLRPGRLDKPLFIDLPTSTERIEILKTLSRKTPLAADVHLEKVALDDRCDGYSGADLASLVREATVSALRREVFVDIARMKEPEINAGMGPKDNIQVTMEDFEKAFANVRPSVSPQERGKYRKLATTLQ